MEKAVEINALLKAVNNACDDGDALLTAAAKLAGNPLLSKWRFTIRDGRLCADLRRGVSAQDMAPTIVDVLESVTQDEERRKAALLAFQHVKGYAYLADEARVAALGGEE